MAATTTKNGTFAPDLEAATERAREANDRLTDAGRKVTTAYLDGVEKYVADFAQFERKLGEQSHVEAVATFLDTHAKLTEDIVTASVSAARELIAAYGPSGLAPTAGRIGFSTPGARARRARAARSGLGMTPYQQLADRLLATDRAARRSAQPRLGRAPMLTNAS